MEGLKMVCPTCKGKLVTLVNDGSGLGTIEKLCTNCNGIGYFEPPQEILDAIECDKIEQKFDITKGGFTIDSPDYEISNWCVTLYVGGIAESFDGETKLEAFQKAEEWLDK